MKTNIKFIIGFLGLTFIFGLLGAIFGEFHLTEIASFFNTSALFSVVATVICCLCMLD